MKEKVQNVNRVSNMTLEELVKDQYKQDENLFDAYNKKGIERFFTDFAWKIYLSEVLVDNNNAVNEIVALELFELLSVISWTEIFDYETRNMSDDELDTLLQFKTDAFTNFITRKLLRLVLHRITLSEYTEPKLKDLDLVELPDLLNFIEVHKSKEFNVITTILQLHDLENDIKIK